MINCVELQALVKMYCGQCPCGVCFLTISFGCLLVIPQHGGGMSHGEHHMMPDGYRSINEAYSQSRVNLQTQFSLTLLNVSPVRQNFQLKFHCICIWMSSFFHKMFFLISTFEARQCHGYLNWQSSFCVVPHLNLCELFKLELGTICSLIWEK